MSEFFVGLLIWASTTFQGLTVIPTNSVVNETGSVYTIFRSDGKELLGVIYLGDGRFIRVYTPQTLTI